MLQDPPDVVQGQVRQSSDAVASEDILAVFAQRLVHVHAVAVVADQGFRHESRGLAEVVRDIHDHVLEDLVHVGTTHQGVEAGADFALSGGRHLVMVNLDRNAHFLQRFAHDGTNVLQAVDRRHRKIPALGSRTVSDVRILESLPVRIPAAFVRVDLVHATVHLVCPTGTVEDEKFRLRAEIRGVGDARGLEVFLSLLGDAAGVPRVGAHGGRFDHVATQQERRLGVERIYDRGARVRHQDHVGLVNAFPAGNRRTVKHFSMLEGVFVDHAGRHGDVLFLAAGVGEAEVDETDVRLLDSFENFFRAHSSGSRISEFKHRETQRNARLRLIQINQAHWCV